MFLAVVQESGAWAFQQLLCFDAMTSPEDVQRVT